MIYLDTQVVVWLYSGKGSKFPKRAVQEMDSSESRLISPMVELELNYLRTRKGLSIHEAKALQDLSNRIDLRICDLPFKTVVEESLSVSWTDDFFDRIIVAQASATNSKLITSDAHILAHYKHALWD